MPVKNMTGLQCTSGTWEISKHGTPDYAPQYGVYSGDSTIATVTGDNARADAALIAAAPDLLKALKSLMTDHITFKGESFDDFATRYEIAMNLARDAINKTREF